MHEVAVFVVPGTFVLLELFAGAELFADAEHAGKDALRRDFQIGGQEGTPVEIVRRPALEAEDMIDGCNHKVEVLGPINEAGAVRGRCLRGLSWIHEVGEGLEGCRRILGSVPFWASFASYIKHPEQGFRFVGVGEIRVIEHHKDLKDGAEVGADLVLRRQRDHVAPGHERSRLRIHGDAEEGSDFPDSVDIAVGPGVSR